MEAQSMQESSKGEYSEALPDVLGKYLVPRDEENPKYVKSFTVDEDKAILEFFNTFGFVVVRDVLSKEDCEQTMNDMWSFLPGFDRNDPSTWTVWPESGMEKHGMPSRPPVFTKPALRNRQNPNVHKVFSIVLGTPDLLVNHDRYGLFRPTKGVNFNGTTRDMPQWKTANSLHLDMDPWGYHYNTNGAENTLAGLRYGMKLNHFIFENNQISNNLNNGLHLQGVLNLNDNFEEDGGFQVVPGFKHHFVDWLEQNKKFQKVSQASEKNSLAFDAKDYLQQYSIRVPMRQGSMVIWDQRMPHGARCNSSSRMRCAQFIKMFPATPINESRMQARSATVWQQVKAAGFEDELTDLGRKLFGLDKHKQSNHSSVPKPKNNNNNNYKERKGRIQGGWSGKS